MSHVGMIYVVQLKLNVFLIPIGEKQMQKLREITDCEVCGNKTLSSALDLGMHPLCDDLVPLNDTRVCLEYPIEILFCDKCVTAHQRFQVPKHSLFPSEYHYRSRHTADVLEGMRMLVESCEKIEGNLSGKRVLDIGCNDGSLLTFFREKGAKTFGIEPTSAFEDAISSGHEGLNDFFCESVARDFEVKYGKPDIITFTNVFAHIEDLRDVISALKVLMHEKTIICIENHYLGAVLEKFQFDTFYHEHPRTYSCTSFAYIADSLGLKIGDVEFPSRYNGNIRVSYVPVSSKTAPADLELIFQREKSFSKGLKEMASQIGPWRDKRRAELEAIVKQHGRLHAKAFPGRAAILVKILGLDVNFIKATYEKPSSCKVNHYIPGTRIPILSDDDFDVTEATSPLLNLAWHISTEIKSYLRNKGYEGAIIDILEKSEVK